MKLRLIPFKGSWLRIFSYRHYEKMKKRNRFVNCQKHLHLIHLNFQNDGESHFQKLKKTFFWKCHFLSKIWFFVKNFELLNFSFPAKIWISGQKRYFCKKKNLNFLIKNLIFCQKFWTSEFFISNKNLNFGSKTVFLQKKI